MQTGYLPEKNLPLLQNNTKDITPESTDMKKSREAEWLFFFFVVMQPYGTVCVFCVRA